MSTGTEATPPPDAEGLQFDHAEFAQAEAPASIACASCHRPITGAYYEINGTIFCEECRAQVERHLKGGSKIGRFLKASVFGVGAAIAGATVYFLVFHYAHIQASLISILCGYIVGKAIRAGTGGRGGRIYQVMAVLLTYLAIGAAYSGEVLASIGFDAMRQQAVAAGVPLWAFFIGVAMKFVELSVRLPVLVVQESILSLAIMGFALWEAWKFTRRAKVVVTGPYRVGGEVGLELPVEKAVGDA